MSLFRQTALAALAALSTLSVQAQSLLDEPELNEKTAWLEEMKAPLAFFKSTRLLTLPTVETAPKGQLDTRVAHRFGDAATKGTTYHTLFGLDQASDIWLGVDYGMTDRWQVGLARVKGAGQLHELWSASSKLRLPGDRIGNMPIRLALAGNLTFSTQTANPFSSTDKPMNEGPFARRLTYFGQLLAAASPHRNFIVQVAPSWVWRNYTGTTDANGLLFLPVSTRFKVTKRFSITAEYAPMLASTSTGDWDGPVFWKRKDGNWFAPLQLGLEMETGGHVFQISLSNSSGLLENDMLPYSTAQWGNGGFRMGFAIMRGFQLGGKKKG